VGGVNVLNRRAAEAESDIVVPVSKVSFSALPLAKGEMEGV
jgi:hypothetical protein